MFRELALRISQKVLIGITQLYGYVFQICWFLQGLPFENLVYQKKYTFKKNIYNSFTIIKKIMLLMLTMVGGCSQDNIIYKCTMLHDHSSIRK